MATHEAIDCDCCGALDLEVYTTIHVQPTPYERFAGIIGFGGSGSFSGCLSVVCCPDCLPGAQDRIHAALTSGKLFTVSVGTGKRHPSL